MREVAGVDDGGGKRIGGVGVLAGRRSRSDGEIGGRAAWTYDGAAGEGVLWDGCGQRVACGTEAWGGRTRWKTIGVT